MMCLLIILFLKTNYDSSINNTLTETLYEQVVLEIFVVSSKNNKDIFFLLKNHIIVKVNKIIKYTSGQIKIEVFKYEHCTMFHSPVPSDIIKIFYINKVFPDVLILIDIEVLQHKCFVVPIGNDKHVAIALVHETI